MTDVTLRAATREDAPRLAANSLRSYPDGGAGLVGRTEHYLTGPYPIEDVFVAERRGVLVGQARTIAYRGWMGGVETGVGGLASVAVAPEARRTGVAAVLVRHHAVRLRDTRTPWAMLYPFAPSFYAAFGWTPASRRLRWRFAASALPLFEERRRVRALDGELNHDAILACYRRRCPAVNGSLSRSEVVSRFGWAQAKDHRFAVGVEGAGGALEGYLYYRALAPTPRPQAMRVTEWVAETPAAERALLGFIAAQADQYQSVSLDTPVEHPLAALLDNALPEREDDDMPPEHQPLAALYSGAMMRVVDLAGALAGRGYPGGPGVAAIEITEDKLLPENQRTVTVSVDGAAASVSEGRAAGAPLVRGPVGPISAVLCGAIGLAEAARLGLCAIEGDLASLDRLLALTVPYPLVYF